MPAVKISQVGKILRMHHGIYIKHGNNYLLVAPAFLVSIFFKSKFGKVNITALAGDLIRQSLRVGVENQIGKPPRVLAFNFGLEFLPVFQLPLFPGNYHIQLAGRITGF